jgi:hypothetical protein
VQVRDGDQRQRDGSRGEAEKDRRDEQRSAYARAPAAQPLDDRLGTGRQQQREGATEVVWLPAGDGERHGEHEVGDAERAAPAQRGVAQQPHQARDPDRREATG